jgi:hypothetical protein
MQRKKVNLETGASFHSALKKATNAKTVCWVGQVLAEPGLHDPARILTESSAFFSGSGACTKGAKGQVTGPGHTFGGSTFGITNNFAANVTAKDEFPKSR